jgi:hypothetical protein
MSGGWPRGGLARVRWCVPLIIIDVNRSLVARGWTCNAVHGALDSSDSSICEPTIGRRALAALAAVAMAGTATPLAGSRTCRFPSCPRSGCISPEAHALVAACRSPCATQHFMCWFRSRLLTWSCRGLPVCTAPPPGASPMLPVAEANTLSKQVVTRTQSPAARVRGTCHATCA